MDGHSRGVRLRHALPPSAQPVRASAGGRVELFLGHNSFMRSRFWMGKPCVTRKGQFAAQFLLDVPPKSPSGGEDDP